ncbi:MAG: DUF1800 family protein [Myxococcaceae bacterium]|nr:MAG: DUF1800 family protein [Myxococcaceae bacterium]
MLRRTALALALCATSCAQGDGPSEQSPPPREQQVLEQVKQAAESLETPGEANSIRFLEQASFGPKLARGTTPAPVGTVEHVMAVGITQSLTEQFATQPAAPFDGDTASTDLGSQFFVRAVSGQDQLRLRVAFALSQIFVVSQLGINDSVKTTYNDPKMALAGHLNLLSRYAFGNFRDLLEAVTVSPGMGRYLDTVNNVAFNTSGARIDPNENYAREMLQLFTLGVHKLKNDGTVVTVQDPNFPDDPTKKVPVPAYTEDQVKAFAHALSGWTWKAAACPTVGKTLFVPDYTQPLMPCDVNHDRRSQTLLNNATTTNNGTTAQHLTQALDNVFSHTNVPPFISKQLIQHLVTSNPSPAYVKRVTNVFLADANGTRGNLEAVVRAILEDTEARGAQPSATLRPGFGHLRSPVLFVTNTVRWLDPVLDTATKDPGLKMSTWSKAMAQHVPRAPSVFSYYPPNAPAPDTDGLLGPEFAILDTATISARANFLLEFLYQGSTANAGITVDYDLLPNDSTELVAYLGRYYLHGTMDPALRTKLLTAMADPRVPSVNRRKRMALYLTLLSPSFQLQR